MPDTTSPAAGAAFRTARVPDLAGTRGLVVGIANASSIAYGDRKSTRLNSSHASRSRMPSSA